MNERKKKLSLRTFPAWATYLVSCAFVSQFRSFKVRRQSTNSTLVKTPSIYGFRCSSCLVRLADPSGCMVSM